MFVASDFGYMNTFDCPQPFTRSLKYRGTAEFLRNLTGFSRLYDAFGSTPVKYHQIYGKLQTAIILDTIMNFNDSELSQSFDNSSVDAKTLHGAYNQLKNNKMRGNFIAAVSNEDGWEAVEKISSKFESPSEYFYMLYDILYF